MALQLGGFFVLHSDDLELTAGAFTISTWKSTGSIGVGDMAGRI